MGVVGGWGGRGGGLLVEGELTVVYVLGLEVGSLKCVQTELHWSTSAFDPLMAFIMSLLGK